jgi:hypothetical protein
MTADELASTVFTAVILFVLALFPLSGYGRAMAREHLMSMVIFMLHSIIFCSLCLSPIHHTL